MIRVSLTVLVAVIAFAACTDNSAIEHDASEIRDLAAEAMAKLESYRVSITVDDSAVLTIDHEAPNQYRTISQTGPDSTDDPGFAELQYIDDNIYSRTCARSDGGCGPWVEDPRDDVVAGVGSQAFFPQWPIVALEMASEVTLEAKGDELIVRGSVNLIRAVLENERRIFDAAGVTAFGRECTSVPQLYIDGTPQQQGDPEPTEFCRDMTYEDLLEQEADDIAAGDANPATIEARIDPETYLFLVFKSVSPARDDDDDAFTFQFEYSRFDEVTIEVPEEFR